MAPLYSKTNPLSYRIDKISSLTPDSLIQAHMPFLQTRGVLEFAWLQ